MTDSAAKKFNAKLISGRLRAAVRELTQGRGGGVLFPDDIDAKTGLPVIDVLRSKHPEARKPGNDAMNSYACCPDPMPLLVTHEAVGTVVWKISRSAEPLGPDAEYLMDMCMRHGIASERLRKAIVWDMDAIHFKSYRVAACTGSPMRQQKGRQGP